MYARDGTNGKDPSGLAVAPRADFLDRWFYDDFSVAARLFRHGARPSRNCLARNARMPQLEVPRSGPMIQVFRPSLPESPRAFN